MVDFKKSWLKAKASAHGMTEAEYAIYRKTLHDAEYREKLDYAKEMVRAKYEHKRTSNKGTGAGGIMSGAGGILDKVAKIGGNVQANLEREQSERRYSDRRSPIDEYLEHQDRRFEQESDRYQNQNNRRRRHH
jgi:hypothetical protein